METVTKSEYPQGVALVCNVCAPAFTEQLVKEKNAQLALDITPDAKAQMIEAAKRLHIPVEVFLKGFVSWRTGKLMDASLYNPAGEEESES